MRIFAGPAIVSIIQNKATSYILLGGDKSNQSKDIESVLKLIEEMEK